MTDDWRNEIYAELNPYQNSAPYHYFKVRFTVYNTLTDEECSMPFYISAKRSLKWLESIMTGRSFIRLPRSAFSYSWKIQEIEDCADIIFHHITTREKWEEVSTEYLLTTVLTHRWKISYMKKFKKFIKKVRTFLSNHIFIYRNTKIITV